MDDLQATVTALAARVQQLEDEREISRVLTRYGFAADVGDADATAALYTDDAVIDIDVAGDRAIATGYVRVYVSDPDMRNPHLWRIGYTKLELHRAGSTWRISSRVSRSVGVEEGANVLRSGLSS